ncbi:tyrosine-type recombinase/integrase [Paludibacterium denitrificans]|uniref:Tyrosine-type recombinase/integrase n=1 Tax=Paludibacterium denitrificans TaxID=2675226 RepID=A0A844GBT8_9NEIS|nr:tyrosine-type recombinase/integrase [Paludibacterium denitrificans]MTD33986.1 tyrosine-type recombinase/integrase [Paludibacterium denitrificans]
MARPRLKNRDLPPRMYRKNGAYYYVTKANKWIRLSADLGEAKRRWVELEAPCRMPSQGMAAVFNRYAVEVLPTKAAKTRMDQERQMKLLEAAFGDFRPDEIKPVHVAQYLDYRAGKGAAVAGNREKALLSHVFTMAMRWGIVESNPCRGVTRNKELPRDRYVDDDELDRFISFARELRHGMLTEREDGVRKATNKDYGNTLRTGKVVASALEIAYLAAQRRQDVLRLSLDAISDDGLLVRQLKTRNSRPVTVLIGWAPKLMAAVAEAKKLPRPSGSRYLFVSSRTGKPYTDSGFNALVQKIMRAREAAGNRRFHFHDLRAKGATDLLEQVWCGEVNCTGG